MAVCKGPTCGRCWRKAARRWGGRFLEQLKPIQRFVIGLDRPEAETAGYILSHPKLGVHLREGDPSAGVAPHFDPVYIQATRATFVRWGRKTVAQLNCSGQIGG